jgi:hypothetical protein
VNLQAPVPAPSRPAPWTGVAARAAGVWILLGCAAKAFIGTPADLPAIVRQWPFALGTTFALVIGIEAFVGLVTLIRPGRAWPLTTLLLLAFAAVAAMQVAAGTKSCGCFGAKLHVAPWVMLVADLFFVAVLLVARPWRLARGGISDVAVALIALGVAVALPRLADREASSPGGAGTSRKWASLDVGSWKGKKVGDTEMAKWADLSPGRDGVWFLYRDSCEICAECLQRASIFPSEKEITLVRLGETGEAAKHKAVHTLPRFAHTIELPDTVDWVLTAPAKLVVENGVVTSAQQGIEAESCP